MKIQLYFFLFVGTLLQGCSTEPLTIYTDYLSHENLASYHVGTPDPVLDNPPIGQRLLVNWWLPKRYLKYPDLHLEITIRLRNHEQIFLQEGIRNRSGSFIFSLTNDRYFDSKGILTYKVEVVGNGMILEEWQQQLWSELITFDQSSNQSHFDDEDEEENKKEIKSPDK